MTVFRIYRLPFSIISSEHHLARLHRSRYFCKLENILGQTDPDIYNGPVGLSSNHLQG